MAQSLSDSWLAGTESGKRTKSRHWKTGGEYCFFMTLPHAHCGFFPLISPVVSTRTEQLHAAFVQCQRSPVFITMTRHLLCYKSGRDLCKGIFRPGLRYGSKTVSRSKYKSNWKFRQEQPERVPRDRLLKTTGNAWSRTLQAGGSQARRAIFFAFKVETFYIVSGGHDALPIEAMPETQDMAQLVGRFFD